MNQQVFHLGDDGKLPVVQHLGQIGTGLAVGKFHWRQRLVVKPGLLLTLKECRPARVDS